MIAILASFLISTNATPRQIVESCRTMIPRDIVLEGRIILRNRKGIPQLEKDYVLTRAAGKTALAVGGEEQKPAAPSENILGTDVTWSDLTLDYLWWDDFAFGGEGVSESVQGLTCVTIDLKKGERTVRVWVDRKYGALMQAEELKDGKTVRRLWGKHIKKFGDRWMADAMEVETLGSGHRTKITVEKLK